jgi:glucokinase
MTLVLAVDVGGTTIKAEVTDDSGVPVASGAARTPKGAVALDAIAALGSRLIDDAGRSPVAAAGVVLPGIVNRVRRIGVYSSNIGWSSLPAGEVLERAWGIPVAVDHDVTCAGWAEWATGAGQGCNDMAFVAIGTGISAALVSGGRLLRGSANGSANGSVSAERTSGADRTIGASWTSGGSRQPGEIGHVVVRPDGPPCGCGARGCMEAIGSAAAIARAYAAVSGTDVRGALDVELAAAHDARARKVWDDAMSALADGLAVLSTLLGPERIVIGGGLAQAGDFLLKPLTTLLPERVRIQPVPALALAAHGMRAGLAGAALLGREQIATP